MKSIINYFKKKHNIYSEFYSNKKIFLLTKDKNKKKIIKIFRSAQKLKFQNEVKGYKVFNKKKIYKIPYLYKYKSSRNFNYIILEYINGSKVSYFEINKLNFENFKHTKNKLLQVYLNNILNQNKYFSRLDIELKKKVKKFIKLNEKTKLITNYSHGDFADYNVIKTKKKYYLIDFEKFSERIVLFDYINWLNHKIILNYSKIFISNKLKIRFEYILILFLNILYKYLSYKFNKKIKKSRYYFINFKLYFFIYLVEKFFLISEDIFFMSTKKNKILSKKFREMILQQIKLFY